MGTNRSLMATILIVFFTVLAVSSALDMSIISYDRSHADKSGWKSDEEVMSIYEEWLVKHGKVYNAVEEKEKRFQIFKDNLNFIEEHNAVNRTYKVGLNRFADRSRMMTRPSSRYAPRVSDNLSESVDWRKEGAVVRVKTQSECGKFCTVCRLLL